MASPVPGGSEAAYLGFALVDALIDLLIEKGTITKPERDRMLRSLAVTLNQSGQLFGQRSAKFIADAMLK